jgi:hypothetical protein
MSLLARFGEALLGTPPVSHRNSPYPTHDSAWDDYAARLTRYQVNEFYYSNTQYDRLNILVGRLRQEGRLYVNTRTIYNPVSRLVGIYADKVYPATINLETLATGAIPVEGDQRIIDALITLLKWSNWNSEKQLYVRAGEKLGDTFIRVVDNVDSRRVFLEVLAPQKIKYLKVDGAGNIKDIFIEYYDTEEEEIDGNGHVTSKRVKIGERITGDTVIIYRDGEEADRYDNPFGFVPIAHGKPTDEDKRFGVVRWNNSRTKIDEINSQAALLNDQTRKSVIPYIATIGGQLAKGALTRSATTMDEIINIAVPQGGDVKAIVPHVDIGSALKNIEAQLDELREDNPELFLYQLTKMTVAPSGVAMENFFDLAVTKIQGAQGVYDDTFRRACQMALTIGGVQGYAGFESFNANSYEQGDLEFAIRPRDVFKNSLNPRDRINFLITSGAPQSGVWDELQISAEKQAAWVIEKDALAQKQMEQQAQMEQQSAAAGDLSEAVAGNVNTARIDE